MAATQDHFDVVIVGAGVHGLCTAKTFLAIDPSLSLLIVDNKSTIGGVWSKEQLYPGLRTNNIQGYFEFSDYPMLDNPDLKHLNIHKRGILPGELVHGYICEYAKRFGLLERTLLKTKVVSAEDHEEDSVKAWSLQLSSETHSHKIENQTITCTKLIVASGLTSQPWLPPFRGVETFQKPCIHTERMGGMSQSLVSDKSIAHVTVVGGGKSAHDAVYLFTKAGKRVTWLIRRTGRGMTPLAKPYAQLGPVSVWLEGILMTRPFTWFGPCPWSDADGFGSIRRFLHSTALGRWIVDSYFENLSAASLEQSGILKEEKTRALVPDQSFMWYGTSTGILTYDDDMYALLKTDRVDFVREDVERLEEGAIILEDGRRLETDAIICATGYNHIPSVQMHPASKHSLWGIPVEHSNDEFEGLESKADSELLERFPVLKSSPAVKERKPRTAPWRLWRFIAPPSQVCSGRRSLAFLSTFTTFQTIPTCEITSLWTYAYLFGELKTKPTTTADVMYEATLWSRFGRWMYPLGLQGKMADFFHDSLPYYDTLLSDLGVRSWRKGWGWVGEIFGGKYEVRDYEGIVNEWIAAREGKVKRA